ncbi:hypothetical protein HMPREF9130_1964 [Peptoniphilus sp. oral taxon 375 str. F0436]|nr:hypothetical protein HMPREF9130_1964 [Peptoniphilus sp. oral taxon 375 str. F0436]
MLHKIILGSFKTDQEVQTKEFIHKNRTSKIMPVDFKI